MSKTGEFGIEVPTLLLYAPRERARAFVRAAFPKRKWKIVSARDVSEFREIFRTVLIDAALVDIGSAAAAVSAGGEAVGTAAHIAAASTNDDSWRIARLAH